MEHIEPAGIHSGDSNAVLPAFNLSPLEIQDMVDYAKKISLALKVKGLIKYTVCDQRRKSVCDRSKSPCLRNNPIHCKSYGKPYLNYATKIMLVEIKVPDIPEEKNLDGFAIKEPVFSFNKFPEVNKELGRK